VNAVDTKPLFVLAALFMGLPSYPHAAESAVFINRLPINQATEHDGHVFVRVQEQRRGATQALERQLIGRATVIAGHWLCNFTPKINQRLNTNLQGINLVHANETSGMMDVVIKLKKQKPVCTVQLVAPIAEPPPSPPELISPSLESDTQIERQPQAPVDTDIKVRVYPKVH